ncbi:transglycosylase SLT domain-containing protein [Piscinibacterium candidicorallinum]|uniref:Transglycosylase SLT domain-containing protein n=1 Tax=Piscinibacterium candidicorallinum TaxID=1793872 RepID=A0ABV7H5S3_9BURK
MNTTFQNTLGLARCRQWLAGLAVDGHARLARFGHWMLTASLAAALLATLAWRMEPNPISTPQPGETLGNEGEIISGGAHLPADGTGKARAVPVSTQYVIGPIEAERLTNYLSRRFRVADSALAALIVGANKAAQEYRVDPLLIMAVMSVESSFNPFAESSMGAQGLMQVMTRVHEDRFERFGGPEQALHPIANIHVGTQILAEYIRRGGSVEDGLKMYVGATGPTDGGYGARVLAERARLAAAAQGRFDFSPVSAPAPSPAPSKPTEVEAKAMPIPEGHVFDTPATPAAKPTEKAAKEQVATL